MNESINVRVERETDYLRVEEVTRSAFAYPARIERGGIGSPYEHWMVHELRKRDGVKDLSLVAEMDNQIVGHIICSKAMIKTGDNQTIEVLNLGPLSVLPEYQSRGIGGALIISTIEKARQLQFGAILFFGHPNYYPRFGFKEAGNFEVRDSGGNNYPAFMAMELFEGYLEAGKGGRYYESDIFNEALNKELVKVFDFKFKEDQ